MNRLVLAGVVAVIAMEASISAQSKDLDRPPWSWFDKSWFTAKAPFDVIGGSASVDLDADGDLDYVVVRSHTWGWSASKAKDGPDVAAFLNDGKGLFTRTELVPLTTEVGAVGGFDWADIDDDGDADVVLWDAPFDHDVRAYRNDGHGGMTRIELPPSSSDVGRTGACFWVRFRGHAQLACETGPAIEILDLSGSKDPRPKVSLRLADGPGRRRSLNPFDAWADFDGDGDLDLAVSTLTANEGVFINDSDTSLRPLVLECVAEPAVRGLESGEVRWADLDGDGLLDLVAAGYGAPMDGDPERILRNAGRGRLVCEPEALGAHIPVGQHSSVAIADFDGDGDLDVFFNAVVNSRSYVAENLGGMRFRTHPFGLPGEDVPSVGGFTVATGDVSGDGRPDLVFAGAGDTPCLLLGRDPRSGQPSGW